MQKNISKKRVVSSKIEHKAVLNPCKKLSEDGFDVILLPADSHGVVSIYQARIEIDGKTLLVSIQLANNEIGTIQPVQEITEIAHQIGAIVHCDAAQAVGKIPVNVEDLGADLLSISAHKLYGPKGVGALFIRGGIKRVPIAPLFFGGGQEHDIRSGTLNVPGIVGLGEACQIAKEVLNDEASQIAGLRDQFEHTLSMAAPFLQINGKNALRLPNTSSLTFPGIDADALLLNLPEVMMGTGSACTSGAVEPSHVLQAMGLSRDDASSTIRASLGRYTTESDIQKACILIAETFNRMNYQTK
jgi:cysteine desulfurase